MDVQDLILGNAPPDEVLKDIPLERMIVRLGDEMIVQADLS